MSSSDLIVDWPRGENQSRRVHFSESTLVQVFEIKADDLKKTWCSQSDECRFKYETRNKVIQFIFTAYGSGGNEPGRVVTIIKPILSVWNI